MLKIASHLLTGSPYLGYSYAYPHKTAYRRLAQPVSLAKLWAEENRQSLFLYLHVPFCEMRCGFCNLFTLSQPTAELPRHYLAALRREAQQVRTALGDAAWARLAIGGGTPTFLSVEELAELREIVADVMGCDALGVPFSIEVSPATVTPEKLSLLRSWGVDRVSIGVQSFSEADAKAMGRPQHLQQVHRALTLVRSAGIPNLNIDLIYGGEGQTRNSWLASIEIALSYQPEELYLYPLYVRPLTGLGKRRDSPSDVAWDEKRLSLYRAGRDLLNAAGYRQRSMRMFQAPGNPEQAGPVYCCQTDGMVGLGCGARSYTSRLHYSAEWAVGKGSVGSILMDYLARPAEVFQSAHHGFLLDDQERKRRFILQGLLQSEGLSRGAFGQQFGCDPLGVLPSVRELEPMGLAEVTDERVKLTPAGLERSDAIGPWLYSERVRRLSEEFAWR